MTEILQNMFSLSSKRKGPITWSGRRGANIEYLWKKITILWFLRHFSKGNKKERNFIIIICSCIDNANVSYYYVNSGDW